MTTTTKTAAKPKSETPANAKEKAGFAEYIVLTVSTDEAERTTYAEIGRVTARNATDAIKAKKAGDGTYAAIPARSLTVEKVNLA